MAAVSRLTASTIYPMLGESQRWPPDRMRSFQQSQLEQLLRHARKTVPYYAERLNCLFGRNDEINWSRWQDVPLLTRNDVAGNFEALQSNALPPGHGKSKVATTSGSTGLPIVVSYTRLLSDVCRALDWRAQANWGFNWSKTAVFWHSYDGRHGQRGPDFNYGSWGPTKAGSSFVANNEWEPSKLVDHLRKVEGAYIMAQGNFPMAAAYWMLSRGENYPLGAVVSHGIVVDDQIERAVKSAFGAKTHGMYSSKEGGRMAHHCHLGKNYHVNAEAVFLEILDEENQPCPPGKPGRVVVTNFYNAAQPFIRYEQGDIANWASGCECGSHLPVIERIDGRIYHLFRRLDGTRFAAQVPDSWREKLQAQFWQFVQTDANKILVRYKPLTRRDILNEKTFAAELRAHFRDDFQIDYEMLDEIPKTLSGKFLKYVCRLPPMT